MTVGRIPVIEGGIQPTIFDAKADLLTATAADTPARLAVGANGTVLKANSATATGLEWATDTGFANPMTTTGDTIYSSSGSTPSRRAIGSTGDVLTVSGGVPVWAAPSAATPSYTLLNAGGTALTGATTITVNITAYNYLLVVVAGASSANASSRFTFRLNGDTASNYQTIGLGLAGASTVSAKNAGLKSELDFARMGDNAANTADGIMHIFGAKGTGFKPLAISGAGDGSTNNDSQTLNGYYKGTSTITSVSILSSSGNFDAGTIYVYGAN
jgi:hypothetical protein